MIVINQLKLPCGTGREQLQERALRRLRLSKQKIGTMAVLRHSIDARKKPQLFDIYSVGVTLKAGEEAERALTARLRDHNIVYQERVQYQEAVPDPDAAPLTDRPVVVGSGPAGLFAALVLARAGYRPLVLERGGSMKERTDKVEAFFAGGDLDPECNIQFGEGGAGTYSDGKLTTNVKDKCGRTEYILNAFTEAGADPSIAWEFHPHIGTDVLRRVVVNLEKTIEDLGGAFLFNTKMTDIVFQRDSVRGIVVQRNGREETFPCQALILALGHSARDTIRSLRRCGIFMEEKNFAVGMRVSHPQKAINQCQYGISDPNEIQRLHLEAASYKLTYQAASGHGVYSFCMCPGGYVVNASSERHRLAVNGMSDFARDSSRANAAIVVTVGPETFSELVQDPEDPVLSGMVFQEKLEERAYSIAEGRIPVESFPDYEKGEALPRRDLSKEEADALCIKGEASMADLSHLLPTPMRDDIIEGMHAFGKRMAGFDGQDALFMGLESRTSSPVRITRDEDFLARQEKTGHPVTGLYPCGEGAGYAGGIMSAALDGMKCAEHLIKAWRYRQ